MCQIFFLYRLCFCVVPENLRSPRLSLTFFSGFYSFGHMFKSKIHLQLIFLYAIKSNSEFIYLHTLCSTVQYHLLKNIFYSLSYFRAFLKKYQLTKFVWMCFWVPILFHEPLYLLTYEWTYCLHMSIGM
jgi:hypothetical protein